MTTANSILMCKLAEKKQREDDEALKEIEAMKVKLLGFENYSKENEKLRRDLLKEKEKYEKLLEYVARKKAE